jgi:hypothetical protein
MLDGLTDKDIDSPLARSLYFFAHQGAVVGNEVVEHRDAADTAVLAALAVASKDIRALADEYLDVQLHWRGEMNPEALREVAQDPSPEPRVMADYVLRLLPVRPQLAAFVSKAQEEVTDLSDATARLDGAIRDDLRLN